MGLSSSASRPEECKNFLSAGSGSSSPGRTGRVEADSVICPGVFFDRSFSQLTHMDLVGSVCQT